MFQHTAARRRPGGFARPRNFAQSVSTHSRPKAAGNFFLLISTSCVCFNTQPPEGGRPGGSAWLRRLLVVSTHSRPKAAGALTHALRLTTNCFNTQPPEGGRASLPATHNFNDLFQHTAARRRPGTAIIANNALGSGFNTQPPEGGRESPIEFDFDAIPFQHTAARRRPDVLWTWGSMAFKCFNTQPPEGGRPLSCTIEQLDLIVSTHSRPKAAGEFENLNLSQINLFQHTAARRRPDFHFYLYNPDKTICFNTQPPEGGRSDLTPELIHLSTVSTHSRPKAAGGGSGHLNIYLNVSTHSRPKAAGASAETLATKCFSALFRQSLQQKHI